MSERQRRDHLRAADVDRSYVADILKKAVDEGRLTLSEYDERLQHTYSARTYGDLDKVILDLPRPSRRSAVQPAVSVQPPVSTAGGRRRSRPRPRTRTGCAGPGPRGRSRSR